MRREQGRTLNVEHFISRKSGPNSNCRYGRTDEARLTRLIQPSFNPHSTSQVKHRGPKYAAAKKRLTALLLEVLHGVCPKTRGKQTSIQHPYSTHSTWSSCLVTLWNTGTLAHVERRGPPVRMRSVLNAISLPSVHVHPTSSNLIQPHPSVHVHILLQELTTK